MRITVGMNSQTTIALVDGPNAYVNIIQSSIDNDEGLLSIDGRKLNVSLLISYNRGHINFEDSFMGDLFFNEGHIFQSERGSDITVINSNFSNLYKVEGDENNDELGGTVLGGKIYRESLVLFDTVNIINSHSHKNDDSVLNGGSIAVEIY